MNAESGRQVYQRWSIPESWCWARLGDLVSVKRGRLPGQAGDPKYFDGATPWVTLQDMQSGWGKALRSTRDHVNNMAIRKCLFLNTGTLVVTRRGELCIPRLLAIPACISDDIACLTDVPSGLDRNYLYHFIRRVRLEVGRRAGKSSAINFLSRQDFRDMFIPIPPPEEQKRLVTRIELLQKRITRTREELQPVPGLVARFWHAAPHLAEHRKMTTDWRNAADIDRVIFNRLSECLMLLHTLQDSLSDTLRDLYRIERMLLVRAFSGRLSQRSSDDQSSVDLVERIRRLRVKFLGEAELA